MANDEAEFEGEANQLLAQVETHPMGESQLWDTINDTLLGFQTRP